MICRTQTIQSQINGYFGGCIAKRQRVGKLETRKCVDKMHVLRARNEGKSEFQQQRAVSGRMITDIEMNGTLRGAVEEYWNGCTLFRRSPRSASKLARERERERERNREEIQSHFAKTFSVSTGACVRSSVTCALTFGQTTCSSPSASRRSQPST